MTKASTQNARTPTALSREQQRQSLAADPGFPSVPESSLASELQQLLDQREALDNKIYALQLRLEGGR